MIRKGTVVTGKRGCLVPASVSGGRSFKVGTVIIGRRGGRWAMVDGVPIPVTKLRRV